MCRDNTAGYQCEKCDKGYYGNSLRGLPDDCKKCPCPDGGTCIRLQDQTVVCLDCPMGYAGKELWDQEEFHRVENIPDRRYRVENIPDRDIVVENRQGYRGLRDIGVERDIGVKDRDIGVENRHRVENIPDGICW